MSVTINIDSCEYCTQRAVDRYHTGDSFETVFTWSCNKAMGKRIGLVEWNESSPPVPKWCPLRTPKDNQSESHNTAMEKIEALKAERDNLNIESAGYLYSIMEYEKVLKRIVRSYEARSELYTNDADCAGHLHDIAREALGDSHE